MNCFTNLWTVKLSDWQRALIVAILTSPFDLVYQYLTSNQPVNWREVLKVAVLGAMGYIAKNFLTGSNGKILTNK